MAQEYLQRSDLRRRTFALVVAGIVVLSIGVLGYLYRGHLFSVLDFADEATGNRTITILSLALVLVVLGCMVLWMLFPIIVYLGLKDLSRRTRSLDEAMRLLNHEIRQSISGRDAPEANHATKEKPPGNEPG